MSAKRASSRAKNPRKSTPSNSLLPLLVQALDAKKAEELQVIDVREQSSITDYMVLATGNSDPHLRALRIEVEKVLDENQAPILGMDIERESGWLVIDAFDVMVHLFTPDNRRKFRLDLLWKDGVEVALEKLIAAGKRSQ
jgi:ribosome-associated protein